MITLIKLIATILMIIDHIGAFFCPDIIMLRVIGRLSMPLFAFLIVDGIIYTKDLKKYLKRLFLFALISQFPYSLLFNNQLNILFSFTLAVLIIYLTKRYDNKLFYLLALTTLIVPFEYKYLPVILILTNYIFFNYINLKSILSIILIGLYTIDINISYQVYAIFSVFLYQTKDIKLRLNKNIFYYFYPLHFFIIFIVKFIQYNM